MGTSAGAARSHRCGELRAEHVGQEVVLCGWVQSRRDHGAVAFMDLRDRYGLIQVVADEDSPAESREFLGKLHLEDCMQVTGTVRMRGEGNRNPDRATGDVEVVAKKVERLSIAKPVPIEILDDLDAPEELRLRYRYLDLRRTPMRRFIEQRTQANHAIRSNLVEQGFVEVETPMLTKSTPEGARDYLVPSRMKAGHVYALPQSPQIFKQLCMVAGLDRYFQIARCLRDEDLRADRQPEFTQLDLEMSFVEEEDVFQTVEQVVAALYQSLFGQTLERPFERMSYAEAMRRYASDKPDLRNPLEIVDLQSVAGDLGFKVFDSVLSAGGMVRGLRVPGGASLSRKAIESIEQTARDAGGAGAAWCKVTEGGQATGPMGRFLKGEAGAAFLAALQAEAGDLVLAVADRKRVALVVLDHVRRKAGQLMDLVQGPDRLLWITEFPLFEEVEDGVWAPAHHPFTSPVEEDLDILRQGQKDGVRSRAYDLVLNGVELGSGSIRIHRREVQEVVFEAIGLSPEQARRRFSFLLEAFDYGPPPHGGFAIGLDRLYALLFQAESIRDVIAFPKTSSAACPLTGAPGQADPAQLEELGLQLSERASVVESPESV
ncbi:MAG: aspartate--tRNA ligase [Planctomycetota bacterium]|nr:MAG: aspartate--tRNA ligase [Planctomycetota bacterium]